MDFLNARQMSEIWTSSDRTYFELILADESERKLVFSCGPISFFVICPDCKAEKEEDRKRWHVWSDNEDVIENLVEVQMFIDSHCHCSITEILNKVNKALQPLLGHAAGGSDDDSDVDDDFDEAYYEADESQDSKSEDIRVHSSSSDEDEVCEYDTGQANPTCVHRLLKDLKNMKKANGQFGVQGNPHSNNLLIWDVQLTSIPPDTHLGQDLVKYSQKYNEEPVVQLEMKFPTDYPMAPPFVRIRKPKFKFLTGHVTIGGSICMELLTKSGWRPINDIEGILVQIRSEILSDPKVRLDLSNNNPYDETEARQAFDRMVKKYNWDS